MADQEPNLFKIQLPQSIKNGLFIGSVLLILAGILGPNTIKPLMTIMDESSEESSIQEVVKVKFILIDEDNRPVPSANVQFIFDNAPEPRLSDDAGYVSISVPYRDEVTVLVSKEGFQGIRRTINLEADKEKTVEYIMKKDDESNLDGSFNKESDVQSPYKSQESSANESNLTSRNSGIGRYSSSGQSGDKLSPIEFFSLYFYRVEHGLYEKAFDMLSKQYIENVYQDFPDNREAFEDYKAYWDKCDMEYEDVYEDYGSNENESMVYYTRRLFCSDDHRIGREHIFRTRKMILSRKLDSVETWEIDSVLNSSN